MSIYDDLPFPRRIDPLPYMLIAGIVLIVGALSFVGNTLADGQHQAQHQAINAAVIADAATQCSPGTRITIIEGTKKTCITEMQRTFRGMK